MPDLLPMWTVIAMDEAEWKRRYAARIMAVASWPEISAMNAAEAVDFDDMDEEFRADPELAADEEMSCWTDDGDDDV